MSHNIRLTNNLKKKALLEIERIISSPISSYFVSFPKHFFHEPVDLSTIKSKLQQNKYLYVSEIFSDFFQMKKLIEISSPFDNLIHICFAEVEKKFFHLQKELLNEHPRRWKKNFEKIKTKLLELKRDGNIIELPEPDKLCDSIKSEFEKLLAELKDQNDDEQQISSPSSDVPQTFVSLTVTQSFSPLVRRKKKSSPPFVEKNVQPSFFQTESILIDQKRQLWNQLKIFLKRPHQKTVANKLWSLILSRHPSEGKQGVYPSVFYEDLDVQTLHDLLDYFQQNE